MTLAVFAALVETDLPDLRAGLFAGQQLPVPAWRPRPGFDVVFAFFVSRIIWLPLGSLLGAVFLRLAVAATRVGNATYGQAYWTTLAASLAAVSTSALLLLISGPGRPADAVIATAWTGGFLVAAVVVGAMVKRKADGKGIGFLRGALIVLLQSLLVVSTLIIAAAAGRLVNGWPMV